MRPETKMIRSALVIGGVLLGMAIAVSAAAVEGRPDVVGSAYDESGDELLYRELHFCRDDSASCTVDYRDPAGTTIARKKLDYSSGSHRPSLVMRDLRTDKEYAVEPEVDAPSATVVDAGFDNYVRSQWSTLTAGEPVHFRFKVVGFDDPIPMKAQQEAGCAEGKVCLKVTVDSWLIGWLADPIELTYARDSQRLLRFRGVSNLRGPDGESQKVDIRYTYEAADASSVRGE
tara:strand:+ start:3187 stop:3879 length:693 start_codon:yes stop_codon:yes gene_type:complete